MTTIAETTKQLICEVDEEGNGLSINAILERIHETHPGCRTTKACVSWYLSKAKTGDLKNFSGKLPRNRNRSVGKAAVATPRELSPAEKWKMAMQTIMESEYSDKTFLKACSAAMKRVNIDLIINPPTETIPLETEIETEEELVA